MARIRTIKPEFWDSPSTALASMPARLLFIAMWNWADDWGVGSANMKSLAAFAFPNDADITASELPTLAKEVADCYGVTFYEVNRRPYYAIPSWDQHQRTERKAKRVNPQPPEGIPAGQPPVTEVPPHNLGNTDTSDGNAGDGTGEQGNRGTGEVKTLSASADAERVDAIATDFATWWTAYPRKKDKGHALKAYKAARKKIGAETLLTSVQQQTQFLMANGPDKCPYGATWLNGERWEDEPDEIVDASALTNVRDLREPPSGLTDEQYDAWLRGA